jgi:hypothetical protein
VCVKGEKEPSLFLSLLFLYLLSCELKFCVMDISGCTHETVWKGLCADCGADVGDSLREEDSHQPMIGGGLHQHGLLVHKKVGTVCTQVYACMHACTSAHARARTEKVELQC